MRVSDQTVSGLTTAPRVAVLIGCASILLHSALALAQTGRGIEISADYDRQCGELYAQQTYFLEAGGAYADISVHSRSYWNASGLILEKGVTYTFEPIDPEATWKDAGVETTVNGWWPEKGLLSWFMTVAGPLLRSPDQNLFQLIGLVHGKCVYGGDEKRACAARFPIGDEGNRIQMTMDGEFCGYANDLPFAYGNNSGDITIRVTRH